VTEVLAAPPRPADARRAVATAAVAVGLALAAALGSLPFATAWPPVLGFAVYGSIVAVVLHRVAGHHPHPRFGLGNGLTLVPAGGAAGFVALACEPALAGGAGGWAALAAAGILLALDGFDGLAARRQGLVSGFGARFDMEVDAVLILALAAIAAGLGKAGPWVLALGLIRYGFVVAGAAAPWLARPLPGSQRRRAVCAAVVAVLGLMLVPPVVAPVSTVLAAAALAALVASFAVDIAWLARRRR
jgi:phosphatidylglycerophosphate synthase